MHEANTRTASGRVGTAIAFAALVCAMTVGVVLAQSAGPAQAATAQATGTLATGEMSALAATGTPDATPTASVSTTRSIGFSVKKRAIVLERFGSGKRRILIVAGIHGDEYGGPVAAKFAAYLRAHSSAIPTGTQVDVIAYSNPDGRVLKRRTNARKVDLNRNFPASNWTRHHHRGTSSHGRSAGSEPETKALVRLLKGGHYTRVVTLHSRGGVIDHNGKGSTALAKRISTAAHVRLARLGRYPGSMGSYVPEKIHIPIVTWELASRTLTVRVRAGLVASLR